MDGRTFLRRACLASWVWVLAAAAQLPEPATVGRIADHQGVVGVRPVNGERWTLVAEELPLAPGDWVRTDVRGPNAVQVRLPNGGSVILGPGTLAEFSSATVLRVMRGELEVTADRANPVTVGPPPERAEGVLQPVVCTATTLLRVRDGALEKLDREPSWLQGFRGTVVKESMGELLVSVDGRDVPLTIGYHKVTIDIRDQIARTVIEESFVNHTSSQLEGVFHFPLPADASISDFGMWIGDELVQADVVEKQRAREIYETILREKRDPGLLEWAGGNLFKARVFPIFPQAEKRVTISYTQVLPMRNGSYRYTYPLVSEMLRQKPLRELQLTVDLSSAAPLTSVRCVSHPARIRQTANAARIEFAAQEVVPTRDFELVVEPDAARQPLCVVPHQRGGDGYFLLLLNPPSERAGRRLLGGSEPLRLIILADTSGSMDGPCRTAQAEFLRALLASLGHRDRLMLAACDVECTWLTGGFCAADDDKATQAMAALAARRSLGWSNLERAVASAAAMAAKADGPCQILYLGDGVVATAETDPAAFAKQLPELLKDAVAKGASCHAVATGSSYEAVVLKALAAQGAGSFRRIEGDGGPVKAARELLEELTRPPVRHLATEFKGLRAARVYPEELPNLPAGAQQVSVGRYQPASLAADATVRITGRLGDKDVVFEQPLRLPPGDAGNSFIPRLWARHHLDYLLAQGAAPEIRDQIVAFSQEYRIMTPYTSFLVLESDADRERFGVRRHIAMRDGEAFFAEGRAQGSFQLAQQQMRQAAAWRAGLQRQALADLAQMGREPSQARRPGQPGMPPDASGSMDRLAYHAHGALSAVTAPAASPTALGFPGGWSFSDSSWAGDLFAFEAGAAAPAGMAPTSGSRLRLEAADADQAQFGGNDQEGMPAAEEPMKAAEAERHYDLSDELLANDLRLARRVADSALPGAEVPALAVPAARASGARGEAFRRAFRALGAYGGSGGGRRAGLKPARAPGMYAGGGYFAWQPDPEQWLNAWVPALPGASPARLPVPPKPDGWTEEAFRLVAALDCLPALAAAPSAVRFVATTRAFEPRRGGRLSAVSSRLALYAGDRWLALAVADGSVPTLTWSTPEQDGAITLPCGLGRVAKRADRNPPVCPLPLEDFSRDLLRGSYRGYRCRVEARGRDQAELVFENWNAPDQGLRLTLDTDRRVATELRVLSGGRVTSRTELERFRRVAGVWWATRITVRDADGEVTARTEIEVDSPAAAEVAQTWAALDRAKAFAILVPTPLPEVMPAKRAAAAGSATVEERLALISHAAATQQWDRALPYVESLGKDLAAKTGWRYLQIGFFTTSRRQEEMRQALLALTRDLAAGGVPADSALALLPADSRPPGGGEYAVARVLCGQAQRFQPNERLEWLAVAKPVYDRQPERLETDVAWRQQRAEFLRQANQGADALAIEEELMRTRPWDSGALVRYAQGLVAGGDYERAAALLEGALKAPDRTWRPFDVTCVRNTLLDVCERAGWYDRQVPFLAAWLAEETPKTDPYQCQRYLTALVRTEREAEAAATAAAWMEPVLVGTEPTPAVLARAAAATHYMVGEVARRGYSGTLDEKWLPALEQAVRRSRTDPGTLESVAQPIMGNGAFQRTDAWRALCAESAEFLAKDLTATDVRLVRAQLSWLRSRGAAVEAATWRGIAASLEKRWANEVAAHRADDNDPQRPLAEQVNRWGELVAQAYREHVGSAAWLQFCRRQHQAACSLAGEAPAEPSPPGLQVYRDVYAEQWFNACLAQAWRRDVEDEAVGILPKLALAAEPPPRALTQADALMSLVDWMVDGRRAAVVAAHTAAPPAAGQTSADLAAALPAGQAERLKPVPAKPLQQLTRTELKELHATALALSREAVATRLAEAASGLPDALRPWVDVERLDLLARLPPAAAGTPALPEQAAEALELLGPQAPVAFTSSADEALFLRRLALAEYLVVRAVRAAAGGPAGGKPAEPATLAAFLRYVRAGASMASDGPRGFWRARLHRLLVALDRPAEIETELRAWVAAEDAFSPWRVPLAYLLAETDRLPDAVAMLERLAGADELGPAEYRALAGWYMALGDREKCQAARLKGLTAADEEQLRQRLDQERVTLSRHGGGADDAVPADLDPEVVDVLTALLRKTEWPGNYAWLIRELYSGTRDAGLLRCLADGITGHTAQQVYPLLQCCREVLRGVQTEATLDGIAAAIVAARGRAQTPVDRRALLLLEAEVRRRASEVLNQPGQHVPAALAALQAAFRETWSPGEPRLMAEYLAALGKITPAELAREQLSQAEFLCQQPGQSTIDHLETAHAYGRLLGWNGRTDAGIDVLLGALGEYRLTCAGLLNQAANPAVDSLAGLYERSRHFVRGEAWLRAELGRPADNAEREWLGERLCQLYEAAIREDGETALGRGQEQYAAVRREIVTELARPGRPQHLQALVSRYCSVARAARGRKFQGAGADLWTFASEVMPGILRRQSPEPYLYQSALGQVAEALHELASPRQGLAFLITCAEAEPAWFRFDYHSFWQQQGWRVAQWRTEVKDLGDLEPRLLAIVLRELRLDLEQRQQRQRTIYARGNPHFWTEKADDFARTAEEVYAQRRNSGAAVDYIAQYLFWGLELRDRAIAMLQDAWQRELLDENAQFRLVTFLHMRERYAESVPVIDTLVAWRPDHPGYRGRHIVAYAKSGRPAEAERARADAEKHLKEEGLWDEQAGAALALGCLDGGLYAAAASYYDEVIALHRRTTRPTAQGDGTLSHYYANLAQAHAGLGDTLSAVDAAAGAVVSWGRNQSSRNQAIGALVQVLRHAKDLDGTVAALDRKAAETRLDSPIVRKALGQVYAEQKAHEKAVAQFRLALAGQPNDEETHCALVASCDALRWPDEAVLQLLALSELLPRDVRLRRDLYERLRAMGKTDEAERAATAIVEAAPTEAESHQAIAALRQEQDRWQEAVPHWRRVAELRALEPTGLLGLATAQLHLGQGADAKASLDRLVATSWPERFGDVHAQARDLRRRLEQ